MGESHPLLDAESERVTTRQVLTAPTFSASPSVSPLPLRGPPARVFSAACIYGLVSAPLGFPARQLYR